MNAEHLQLARPLFYVLNEAGNPEPVERDDPRLYQFCHDHALRRVARSHVQDWDVSTVFLVIDHGWQGPPVLWETMVFGPEPWTDWQERYTSAADAIAGHDRVVATIAAGNKPDDLIGSVAEDAAPEPPAAKSKDG